MKRKYTYRNCLKAVPGMMFCLAAFASCHLISDDYSNCPPGVAVKVTVRAATGVPGEITETDIQNVMLYVFDDAETLLEIIPTEIGKTEYLDYIGWGRLHAVAVANLGSAVRITAAEPGKTKLSDIRIALLKENQPDELDGVIHRCADDLFWGSVDIENKNMYEDVTLPVKRVVAGVYVRISGLKRYVGNFAAQASDFHVVLGVQHNTLDFRGQPSFATRAVGDVNHMLTGSFRIVGGWEYLELPIQEAPYSSTGFEKIMATDDGMPVSVAIHYNGTLLPCGRLTADKTGNPLSLKNGLLNTIEIDFTGSDPDLGFVTVTITALNWGVVPPFEKKF